MSDNVARTAMYLVGHGSKIKPRLIELQYRRIVRYRNALIHQFQEHQRFPVVFLDFQLPRYGAGIYDLDEVPGFKSLYERVQNHEFDIVYIDLEEYDNKHETWFVTSRLKAAGATVLNAFTDDRAAFALEVRERYGDGAKPYEVTEESDFVLFFPSLTAEITTNALNSELGRNDSLPFLRRIESLKKERPYNGGGVPFIEPRLGAEWRKPTSSTWR